MVIKSCTQPIPMSPRRALAFAIMAVQAEAEMSSDIPDWGAALRKLREMLAELRQADTPPIDTQAKNGV